MLRQILRAAEWGSALAVAASCGGGTESENGPAQVQLDPYPELACHGPIYNPDGGFGYHGQCCDKALCMQPDAGACPPASEVGYHNLPGYPPGSGSCTCGDPVRGPYAPHAASEGPCCYVVGSISCDGRPLLVAGEPRLAPTASRSDWARRAQRLG